MGDVGKILIIEDDNALRSVLSCALLQNEFSISDCMLLREAEALMAADTFDLIISDIGLPDGSGLDFCSQQKRIPFIIMSGQKCSEQAKVGGAKAYISKPFDIEDMLNAIATMQIAF